MNRQERRAAERRARTAPKVASATSPSALHQAGVAHLQMGRLLDAQVCCARALALDPEHLGALHLMGLLALQSKQYDAAVEWIGRADRQDPKAGYLLGLATALEQQGLLGEALKVLERAVKLRPEDAEAWTKRADLLVLAGQPEEAISSFESALQRNPRYWFAAYNCALVLGSLQRYGEALAMLTLSKALQPDHVPTLHARSAALCALDRPGEALPDGQRAQALDPENADICLCVGDALQQLSRYEEALAHFDRALALRPGFVDCLLRKGMVLGELQRFDEALAVYSDVNDIEPDDGRADWNASLILLLQGDLSNGWKKREARWKVPTLPGTARYPKFGKPMWQGESDIAGKTILVGADEGIGDTIQFVRYVQLLADRGARVILAPQAGLHSLLSELPGVSQCLPNIAGLPPFDFHCPIMSLPFAFGTTLDNIPWSGAYLPKPTEARAQVWEQRLGRSDRPRVGLVWSGNAQHKNDHNRSVPLETLAPIVGSDATFISLQKDLRPDDAIVLAERSDIVDLTEHLSDFRETVALISCLDVVITVDTSVAHLAAALGRPTWILLPLVPDFRWLLDRDDSPWYPTARLFRQTSGGDYADVVERIRAELAVWTSGYGKQKGVRP